MATRNTLVLKAINEAAAKPFRYGSMDCCMFAAEVIEAFTGQDYASDYRGFYRNREESYGVVAKHGTTADMVSDLLDLMPVYDPEILENGDVALVHMPLLYPDPIVGVVFEGSIVLKGRKRVFRVPLDKGLMYWHLEAA